MAAITNAPPVYSKDETPAAFLAGEFIRWLASRGATRRGSRISPSSRPHPPFVVPAPYNTMYDPADGPAFRRAATGERPKREIHPYVAYELDQQKRRSFLPGMKGKVADCDDAEFRRDPRASITA